jgi:hypothetical protein
VQNLAHHALLGIAVACLAGAGWRIADRASPSGLSRVLAAVVLAVALAVLEALGLGLVRLADSSLVLAVAAVATYLIGRRLLPRPALGARSELATWWEGGDTRARIMAGAAAGTWLLWMAWQLRHPYLSHDGFTYHLPLASEWAQNGRPGEIVDVIEGVPVANYPVTNEVFLSWALALSSSWVAASLWTPTMLAILVCGAVVGLRALRVPGAAIVAAVAAFALQPLVTTQLGAPLTDVVAAGWLVAAAALCVSSLGRPALLPIALVAAALSFGTKTTGTLLLVVALAVSVVVNRRAIRGLPAAWALVVPLALAVGGVWTARNLLTHGSPLWPFVTTSWGDPVPPAFAAIDASFLDHPRAMLQGRVANYLDVLAGSFLLLIGVAVALVTARTRAVAAVSALAGVALLVWAAAPYTGIADSTALAVGATRYMLPALATCTLALALAARDASAWGRRLVLTVLWTAAFFSAGRTWDFGFPYVPALGAVILWLAIGAAAALVIARAPRAARSALAAAGAGVAVLLVSGSASGYIARHAEAELSDASLLRAASSSPAFTDGDLDIAMGPATVALLRGDHLRHRLAFLDGATSCRSARSRLNDGWVVLQRMPETAAYRHLAACLRAGRPRYEDGRYQLYAR